MKRLALNILVMVVMIFGCVLFANAGEGEDLRSYCADPMAR